MTSFNVGSGNTRYSSENGVLYSKAKDTLIVYPIGKTGAFTIPNSVTSIEEAAFAYCIGLTGSLTIPNSVMSIGEEAFAVCSGLTSITIPNSVTSIGSYVFAGCSGLTSVEIPNSITSIGEAAFYLCSGLTSVEIPNSVTSIGDGAFSECSGLTSVTNLNPVPQTITSDVFTNVPISSDTLFVPAGSLAAYQAADVWKYFGTILEKEDTIPTTNSVISNTTALVVYPNPVVNGELRVENGKWRMENGELRVEIYNVNGVLVGARRALPLQGGNITIDISHLPAGEYILKIGNRTAKVVKK
ncbi:hypothetical protein FACS1894201_04240 [Bacteroidia bacterium]|nr:hypothetical protein FACS1894201_04240 [Bacteroidia bacterium]